MRPSIVLFRARSATAWRCSGVASLSGTTTADLELNASTPTPSPGRTICSLLSIPTMRSLQMPIRVSPGLVFDLME